MEARQDLDLSIDDVVDGMVAEKYNHVLRFAVCTSHFVVWQFVFSQSALRTLPSFVLRVSRSRFGSSCFADRTSPSFVTEAESDMRDSRSGFRVFVFAPSLLFLIPSRPRSIA